MKIVKIAVALLSMLAFQPASQAQQSVKTARIGVLTLAVAPSGDYLEAFRRGLRDLGYVEGRNISLEYRFAEGRADRLPELAAELVRGKADVIVIESGAAALAAKRATQTIPIVIAAAGDPVRSGLVASLARPGANITGLSLTQTEISAKRLQLLKEVAPKTAAVAVILNTTNPAASGFFSESEAAARALGLQLQRIEVRGPGDLDAAFNAVAMGRPSAFITLPDGMLWGHRARIVEFAAKHRLPGIFPEREFVEAGGLMSYGPSFISLFRRAALFVDKVLKGAKPGDLPMEQAAEFELVLNMKTAKALEIKFSDSLVQRAHSIIR